MLDGCGYNYWVSVTLRYSTVPMLFAGAGLITALF